MQYDRSRRGFTHPLDETNHTDRSNAGHALRRNAGGAFGPDLAKKLAQLVKMEKNVMRSLETVAKERMEVAVGPYPLLFSTLSCVDKLRLATTVHLGRGRR